MKSLLSLVGGRAVSELIETFRFLGGVIAVWFVMVTFFFAAFHIPSESMQPALQVGDRVLVSKFAYGYSRHSLPLGIGYLLPESWSGRIFGSTPERGHVIVVRDPGQGVNLIKRVIGLPGDRVEVRAGRLYINGDMIPRQWDADRIYRDNDGREVNASEFTETLPGGETHTIYERTDSSGWDNAGPYIVPANNLFLMGDNRDASRDSRDATAVGYVHTDEVVGRAWTVFFTFASCRKEEDMYCPGWRVWKGI
jgi:signal peptidase I